MTNTNYFTRQNLTKRFTNSLCQHKPSFDFKKNYCQDLLKTHSEKLVQKRCGRGYFCGWPYCICICRSFPFRHKSMVWEHL